MKPPSWIGGPCFLEPQWINLFMKRDYLFWNASLESFAAFDRMPVAERAKILNPYCFDTVGKHAIGWLRYVTGNKTITTCKGVADFCGVAIVTALCPVECGCKSPMSGLERYSFCPANCANDHRLAAELRDCEDMSDGELAKDAGWQMWIEWSVKNFGDKRPDLHLKNSCFKSATLCWDEWFPANLAWWCPQTCGCLGKIGDRGGHECPLSCTSKAARRTCHDLTPPQLTHDETWTTFRQNVNDVFGITLAEQCADLDVDSFHGVKAKQDNILLESTLAARYHLRTVAWWCPQSYGCNGSHADWRGGRLAEGLECPISCFESLS